MGTSSSKHSVAHTHDHTDRRPEAEKSLGEVRAILKQYTRKYIQESPVDLHHKSAYCCHTSIGEDFEGPFTLDSIGNYVLISPGECSNPTHCIVINETTGIRVKAKSDVGPSLTISDKYRTIWSLAFPLEIDRDCWVSHFEKVKDQTRILLNAKANIRRLKAGANFTKKNYQALSSLSKKDPTRFVQLSPDETELTWTSSGSEQYDKIDVKDIVKVTAGGESEVFRRMVNRNVPKDLCFTVVSSERTLDLVAEDGSSRDSWVDGLRALTLRRGKDTTSTDTRTSQGEQLQEVKIALEARGEMLHRLDDKTAQLRNAAAEFQRTTKKVLWSKK